ncbi:MAG: Bug family tripartite tricarboxylate transporter substrate binding protein [Burkholderiales bacterium]
MRTTLSRIAVLAFAALPWSVVAQPAWPSKPIRVIVPFAAGSGTDSVARAVTERLSRQLGQPMVIDNRPGAGGTIGSAALAQAEPDGHTIMVHSNSHTVTPATYRNLSYDPVRDIVGVIPLASVPMVLVISPSKGVRTLADLVRMARAKPNSINYASAGTGGATHLGAERLRLSAGYTGTHIPFKGSNDALTEVIAGRVDYYYSPIGLAQPFLKSDRLVALAVSSTTRSSALPDVPTTIEAGFPNTDYGVWIAMFAPAKTPRAIVNRLNEESARALRSPETREKFATLVMDNMIMSADEFDAFLKRDFEVNAELVKAAGIQPN